MNPFTSSSLSVRARLTLVTSAVLFASAGSTALAAYPSIDDFNLYRDSVRNMIGLSAQDKADLINTAWQEYLNKQPAPPAPKPKGRASLNLNPTAAYAAAGSSFSGDISFELVLVGGVPIDPAIEGVTEVRYFLNTDANNATDQVLLGSSNNSASNFTFTLNLSGSVSSAGWTISALPFNGSGQQVWFSGDSGPMSHGPASITVFVPAPGAVSAGVFALCGLAVRRRK